VVAGDNNLDQNSTLITNPISDFIFIFLNEDFRVFCVLWYFLGCIINHINVVNLTKCGKKKYGLQPLRGYKMKFLENILLKCGVHDFEPPKKQVHMRAF